MNKEYNGWSNKATWMIMNYVLANIEFSEPVTPDQLKKIVDDDLFGNTQYNEGYYKIVEYAKSFVNEVDYNEIAEAINDSFK